MKIRYEREEDILTVETARGRIDHAEEAGPVIVHIDKRGRPLLLEILDASRFAREAVRRGLRLSKATVHA